MTAGVKQTATVTIRYFAAARAAAGVSEESVPIELPSTIERVLDDAVERHGPGLARVLSRCSYLLDEVAVHDHRAVLGGGAVLDVLPPFAGG